MTGIWDWDGAGDRDRDGLIAETRLRCLRTYTYERIYVGDAQANLTERSPLVQDPILIRELAPDLGRCTR